jgi:tetratricopeptide (TPR) repeat protein
MIYLGRMRIVLLVALFFSAPANVAGQANLDALFQEARRLFDALDYENAAKALDQTIAAIEATPPKDMPGRERLASAYEMRARSKFGLGNPEEAKADFISLLRVSPGYTLTGQVSPRVVALFDETVAAMVTSINVAVTPPTATLLVDGIPLASGGIVKVVVGDHEISAA